MTRNIFETAAVFVAVLLLYTLLLSPIPVDDVARYVHELGENRFNWDLGHVWAQPLALIAYRIFGSSISIINLLESLNVLAVALGVGIFFDTMRQLGHSRTRSALAALLVAISFNLMALGPTGHIKLLVFPPLALALRHAVLWESAFCNAPDETPGKHLWLAGIWVGIGANFLVSILPMAVFVTLCIAVRARLQGYSYRRAIRATLPFAIGTAIAGLFCLLAAYFTALGSHTTQGGVQAFVFQGIAAKENLHVGFASLSEIPVRFTYSLIYNFAYIPDLGSLGRAAMWGLLPDVSQYAASLARDIALGLFSGAALLLIAIAGARTVYPLRTGLLLPFGFIAGATAFSAYYNLNDPEHWFQFTLPVVFIALQSKRRWLDIVVLGIWLPWLSINNLALYGIPKANFAYEQRQAELRQALGPKGLYVGFAGYPGEPDTSLFVLDDIERYKIDIELVERHAVNVSATLRDLDAHIDATLLRGGRVLMFRALDMGDWRGPVMSLTLAGMTKERISQDLRTHYDVQGPMEVAGFPAWEIKTKTETGNTGTVAPRTRQP